MKLIIHLEQEDWKKKDIVVDEITNYTFYPATYSGCKITFEIASYENNPPRTPQSRDSKGMRRFIYLRTQS